MTDNEIVDVERLVEDARFPGTKRVLNDYLSKLRESALLAKKESLEGNENAQDCNSPVVSAPEMDNAPVVPSNVFRSSCLSFIPIENYSWDQGAYNTPSLTVYVDLPNVGSVLKDNVTCKFGPYSFDLQVIDLDGKNYRLVQDNLEKDIVPESCKVVVKKDKIVLKLVKKKGEYSYESWNQLIGKKTRDGSEKKKGANPTGDIMEMMKDLYNDGDETTKKIIGEAMMKSQRGEKMDPPDMGKFK